MVFLSPIPGTRNKKNIAFTEFGRDFAEKTVGILRMAELDALAELSPEERELYIRLNEKYNCRLGRSDIQSPRRLYVATAAQNTHRARSRADDRARIREPRPR